MKCNEYGFRPPLCTYSLNWATRTSSCWWYEWDGTALETQDSKFEPWQSEVELVTSRSRSPQCWRFTSEQGRNILFIWNLNTRADFEPAISDQAGSFNYCTRAPPRWKEVRQLWRFQIEKTLGLHGFIQKCVSALTLYPPNYSIWIFTHLKLCLADAIHIFKCVKIIQIWQNGGQNTSNLAD